MSFGFYSTGHIVIQSGRSNGRNIWQDAMVGRMTISGVDTRGKKFKRVVVFDGGEVVDNKYVESGKLRHRIVYGKFEHSVSKDGKREIVRFNPRGGKGRHGKSMRYESLFGRQGVCHSWFKLGRLVRQKFIYDNGRQAYDWKRGGCMVRDYSGKVMLRLTGQLDGSGRWDGHSVLARDMEHWFLQSSPFSVERYGKVIFAGQHENHQRVGKWILDGKEHFYEHGVAIPKKLFETPPEKLDPRKLLRIDNAQLRMALMAKANFNAKRLAEIGTVIHKDGSMRLFDVKGLDTRILKVVCPSTSQQYYIRVPRDSEKCEAARQWTFHVGAGVSGRIKFAQET